MDRRRAAWVVGSLLVGVAVVVAAARWRTESADRLGEALRDRGAVLRVDGGRRLQAPGARFLRPREVPGSEAALAGHDPSALAEALRRREVRAVLAVPTTGPAARGPAATVRARLSGLDHLEGFRGELLAPEGALYVLDEPVDVGEDPALLALLARGILEGRAPPPLEVFPAALRRLGSVEVMVLLRQNGQARLWRSARDSSVAKALVTAATVARQRWDERESAMGGPLERQLARLDVEVALLAEDGTLGATTEDFVERAFAPEHGVAYEQRGARRAWRYLLPEATAREGRGSAVAAYRALFRENDLPDDSFGRPDLRFYRLVVRSLGRSAGSSLASPVGPLPEPGASPSGSGRAAPPSD